MLSKVMTATLLGLEAAPVMVETDDHAGLPALNMVGLASTTVKEAGERIRSAIGNTGYQFPCKRITINFAPAATKKEGSHFDLPIAVGILTATDQVDCAQTQGYALLGELSLGGSVTRIKGAMPLVMGLKEHGAKRVVLPEANVREASIVKGIELFPVRHLSQVVRFLQGEVKIPVFSPRESLREAAGAPGREDYADVRGQEHIKRIMVICAAGLHGLLMVGSPGAGKSMMAKRLPTIMPRMSDREILEATRIYSVAGHLSDKAPIISERPFRAPYQTISPRAFVGGGTTPAPGEISFAHGGILFLDELLEFSRKNLEMLRQPMEEGVITIARAGESVRFPSRFVLVAACNPCPCGYRGDPKRACSCSESQLTHYLGKLSGPLLDRIDLQATVPSAAYSHIAGAAEGGREAPPPTSSAQMKAEVEAAAAIQKERYRKEAIATNGELTPNLIRTYCKLSGEGERLMEQAFEKMSLSARGYHKVLRVARTIADLSQSGAIEVHHLAEALQYRQTAGGFLR